MKRTCKNIDITNEELITQAVYECFRPYKKRQRADARALFARALNIPQREARKVLRERGERYEEGIKRIVGWLQHKLVTRKLDLAPVRLEERIDPGSKKCRKISVLGIRQLMLDHVAVAGLKELAKRIGEYQVSSIPARGAAYGKKAIERWLAKSSNRYAVKLDIRDFYGSINREKLIAWLKKRVKNEGVLWLVTQLVYSCPRGIAIGSYLSQTLANIYLSDLYHLVTERCRSKRGSRQVTHALFYMDDMLLVGKNKRQLRYAACKLVERAGDLGLQVKTNWQVHKIQREHPVDMMGYRFSHGLTTLRKRVFKAARRVLLRAARQIRRGRGMGVQRARKLASYHGYTGSAACGGFMRRMGAGMIYKEAFNVIKNYGQD